MKGVVMSLEEKYERCCDFFEMDHMISYYTHKRLGTVKEWVDDTVAAYNRSVPRFLGPLAKVATKLAPNLALRKTFDNVFWLDQQHHDISEFEYSEPKDGTIVVRWKDCKGTRNGSRSSVTILTTGKFAK